MLRLKNILTFLMFLVLCNNIVAQKAELQIKVYGFEEGLSHRNVFKIQQDPLGFIWIATFKGLNRFDGKEFTPYLTESEDNIILDNFVDDILISKDTLIWMAGNSSVSVLDPLTNKVTKIETDSSSVLHKGKGKPLGLYADHNNRIWTASYSMKSGKSYLQFINKQNRLQDVMPCEGNFMRRAIIGKDGHLFISFIENNIRELDGNGNWVKDHQFENINEFDGPSWVTQMQLEPDGTLWVLFSNGRIYFRTPNTTDFKLHPVSRMLYTPGNKYNTFLVEENGNLWVGGINALWRYTKSTDEIFNYSQDVKEFTKNSCNFRHIIKDISGVIWVASDYGAIKIVNNNKLFTNYLHEGHENCSDGVCSIRGIAEDDKGNIYISYYNSIHVINPQNNTSRPLFFQNYFNNSPFSLLYHDNALWTGNGKRIDLTSLEVKNIFKAKGSEGLVLKDEATTLWFAEKNKLYQYDPDKDFLTEFHDLSETLPQLKDISYLLNARNEKQLWVASKANGIALLDKQKGIVEHYHKDSLSTIPLSHNRVIAAYEGEDNILWVATADGLNKLNFQTQKNKVYTLEDGLPNNFINGLLPEGDSCIWVSTDNGLSRFDIKKEKFHNFTTEDGLTKNEFNRMSFFRAKDGRMYFGGLNGINAFYPNPKFLNRKFNSADKILLTSFSKLDGLFDSIITRRVGLSEETPIELNHRDRFFTFRFALANYSNPQKNLYSYKLDGYETEWSEPATLAEARYNNIPAGKYTFRVRSASSNGHWSEDQLSVPVQIKEAFFKSWWFIALCFLTVTILLYAVQQYRIRNIHKRQLELEEIVAERTRDLEMEKKKSEDLLMNILPEETAKELMARGKAEAKHHEFVSVLFTDFKDFSKLAERMAPEELVTEIDFCFKAFDEIMDIYGLEKIKTIGDAYMCAAGIPVGDPMHAFNIVSAALEIQTFMAALKIDRKKHAEPYFEARLGIHTGSVIAGIVGVKKFAYDIWGDTVNIASRMESAGQVGKVNISQSTYELVKDEFVCTHRGKVAIKHKGEIDMYFVEGAKGEIAALSE